MLDADSPEVVKLIKRLGIPSTPTVRTPRGCHFYFQHPGGKVPEGKLATHFDLKADGGYVLCPPSIHPSGTPYVWEINPKHAPFAAPPAWFLALIDAKEDRYALAALYGELERLAGTVKPGRNEQLNRSAFSIGQLVAAGKLDREHVEAALREVALNIGLEAGEVDATIRSGLEAGIANPRDNNGKPIPVKGAGQGGVGLPVLSLAEFRKLKLPKWRHLLPWLAEGSLAMIYGPRQPSSRQYLSPSSRPSTSVLYRASNSTCCPRKVTVILNILFGVSSH